VPIAPTDLGEMLRVLEEQGRRFRRPFEARCAAHEAGHALMHFLLGDLVTAAWAAPIEDAVTERLADVPRVSALPSREPRESHEALILVAGSIGERMWAGESIREWTCSEYGIQDARDLAARGIDGAALMHANTEAIRLLCGPDGRRKHAALTAALAEWIYLGAGNVLDVLDPDE
jgi:hypothetical protein